MASHFLRRTLIHRSFTKSSYILRSPLFATSVHTFSTEQPTSSLNDSNPNCPDRSQNEPVLDNGSDHDQHWIVVMEEPKGERGRCRHDPYTDTKGVRDEIIRSYIDTLAKVVGSYDEAKMKIYSVTTRGYYGFGALMSEELSNKIKELPGVRCVLHDSDIHVKNKDRGGRFVDGKEVPYDPKYHEEWMYRNARVVHRMCGCRPPPCALQH